MHLPEKAGSVAETNQMQLSRPAFYARASARMRDTVRRRGTTCQGYILWTEAEDEICRRLHPDYSALLAALPGRTKGAVKRRCGSLGVTKKLHPWTGKEISDFRRIYPTAPAEELRERFDRRTRQAIEARAQSLGVRRAKPQYVPTGNYLLDALRSRCHEQGLTMRDLDEFVGRRKYFSRTHWRGRRGYINYNAIAAAIHEIGGRLSITWEYDE